MRGRADLILVLAAAAIAGAQPASAEDSSKADQDSAKVAKDPNEWICEKQPNLGTRLATRQVCGTRAEWEEKRRLDRDAIDKAQTQIGVIKI